MFAARKNKTSSHNVKYPSKSGNMSLYQNSPPPPATPQRDYIIQSPRLCCTLPGSIYFLLPGARIDLQIALGCGKHLICVCVWGCVRARKGFLLLPSDCAAPLPASLECQAAHTISLPSRPMSGCNDRSMQGSESNYLICGGTPRVSKQRFNWMKLILVMSFFHIPLHTTNTTKIGK